MESRLKEIDKLIYQAKKKIDLIKREMMNLISNAFYGEFLVWSHTLVETYTTIAKLSPFQIFNTEKTILRHDKRNSRGTYDCNFNRVHSNNSKTFNNR